VQPHTAYFGQKDAQQAIILKKMSRDLNFPVNIKVLPTVREQDGLAMSSRNAYLNPDERVQAISLYNSLKLAKSMMHSGEKNIDVIRKQMEELITKQPDVTIDYLQIVDVDTLNQVNPVKNVVLIAGAVYIGNTRLIDNMIINCVNGEEVIL
jgi:pantoate--beta-alanine ligase